MTEMGTRYASFPDRDEERLTAINISALPLFLPKVESEAETDCCSSTAHDYSLDHARDHHPFSLQRLAWALQNGLSALCVERYLKSFNAADIAHRLEGTLSFMVGKTKVSVPILFFAVERNASTLVRILCEAGALPDSSIMPYGIPVLAYAIFSSEYEATDTSDIVITLLAMGARPHRIPIDMWKEPIRAPSKDEPEDMGFEEALNNRWCNPELRQALARTFNLMQRYSLRKSLSIVPPTPRSMQAARANGIIRLFETPYHIIGQQGATQIVLDRINHYYSLDSKKPLVLLLTGLSGHGKTELARCMGSLLSVSIHIAECTAMTHATDLLGPQAPYSCYDEGSPLNNYLAKTAGQRSIVFLDEFDKTTNEVRKSLLELFDTGKYNDRRNNDTLDCKRVIWVLAANTGVETISRFWNDGLKDITDDQHKQRDALLERLQRAVQRDVKQKWSSELCGRISATIPYVPFSEVEQAVMAYKFMREHRTQTRKLVDVKSNQFHRHCAIKYIDDGQIASYVAREYYDPQMGARSLSNAVEKDIAFKLLDSFNAKGKEIEDEMNEGPLEQYEVRIIDENDGDKEVRVDKTGLRDIQCRKDV